jgi:hypothetical protein
MKSVPSNRVLVYVQVQTGEQLHSPDIRIRFECDCILEGQVVC